MVKDQGQCDLTIMTLTIIIHHNSGKEGKVVTIFLIWSDTELATLVLGTTFETVATQIFCTTELKTESADHTFLTGNVNIVKTFISQKNNNLIPFIIKFH